MNSDKVLIIDQEQSVIEEISVLLKGMGYECLAESEGEAGFARAKREVPALIILAVELPDISGYLICKRIKEDKKLREIPLILTSSEAKSKDFEKHRRLKVKANDYLPKPFSESDMKIKVENLLGIQATREDYTELETKVHEFLDVKAELEKKTEEQKEQISVLEENVRSISRERDELSKKMREEVKAREEKQLEERGVILEEKEALRREVDQLRKKMQEQQGNERVLREELDKLEEDKGLLERRVSELEELIREIEALKKRLEQASSEKESLSKQLESESRDREFILEENEALKKEVKNLQQRLEKSEQKLNKVGELVEKTKKLKSELENLRSERNTTIAGYEERLAEKDEEGKRIRKQLERLQEEKVSQEGRISELVELKTLEGDPDGLKGKLAQAFSERESLLKQCQMEAAEKEALLVEKEGLQKEVRGLQQSLQKSEERLSKVGELVKKTKELKAKLDELSSEKERMETDYQRQLQDKKEEGLGIKEQIKTLEIRLTEANKIMEEFKIVGPQLEKEREELKAERDRLREKLESTTSRIGKGIKGIFKRS